MSSRIRSLTPTYFLSTYLVLIILDSVGNEQAKTPVLMVLSVDAQEVSDGWVVLSNEWVMSS